MAISTRMSRNPVTPSAQSPSIGRAPLEVEAKLGEELNGGIDVFYHYADVVHALDGHDVSSSLYKISTVQSRAVLERQKTYIRIQYRRLNPYRLPNSCHGIRAAIDQYYRSTTAAQVVGLVLSLDELLTRLGEEDAAAAQVAQLHLFGGLSVEEAGAALGLSRPMAYQNWKYTRAWLREALKK